MCTAAGLLLSSAALADEVVIYVNQDAPAPGTGESWTNAFQALQDAIGEAQQIAEQDPQASIQLWVAEGVYRPDFGAGIQPGDQNALFHPPKGSALYGGFAGTEVSLGEQDPALHPTILSGDLAQDDLPGTFDNMADNSHQIMILGWHTTLDGFELSGGFVEADCGAGAAIKIYLGGSDPSGIEINRCTFRHNRADFTGCADEMDGGAAVQINSTKRVTFRDCLFIDNLSSDATNPDDIVYGGALGAFDSELQLIDCTFRDNQVMGSNSWGGGLANSNGYLLMANCVFTGNQAGHGGGFFASGQLKMANCVLRGNVAESRGGGAYLGLIWDPRAIVNSTIVGNSSGGAGGGLFLSSPIPVAMGNSIVWGNEANGVDELGAQIFAAAAPFNVRFSCVQGIAETFGNLNQDPLFFDADGIDDVPGNADDDLRLAVSSKAVDSGNSLYLPGWLTVDLDGYARVDAVHDDFAPDTGVGDPVVDMGAYEHPMAGDVNGSGYVNVTDVQCTNLTRFWQEGGSVGPPPSCVTQPAYADMNANGLIEKADADCIAEMAVGDPPPCAPEL